MAQSALLKSHLTQEGTKAQRALVKVQVSMDYILNALHCQEIHSIKALRLSGILLYQQQFSILNYAYVGLYLPLLDGNHGDIDPT